MLISVGKVYTAFNLTSREVVEMLNVLETPPVIWPASLYIDPEERKKHLKEPAVPFTLDLAQEYADLQTKDILKLGGWRQKTIKLALDYMIEMTQASEKVSVPNEWDEFFARWLNPYAEGIIYEIISRLTGSLKRLEREVNGYLAGSYMFLQHVDLEEVVMLMHRSAYPLKQEVKGLTRELCKSIAERHSAGPVVEAVDDVAATTAELPPSADDAYFIEARQQPDQGKSVDKNNIPRGAIPALLRAIKDEADKHGLPAKYYVKSDRAIRYWLEGKATPDGFSMAVLVNNETRIDFARKYIEAEVAKGSSELAANAKKDVTLNHNLHGINLETPEDAMLMSSAYKELAKSFPGGSKAGKKRRSDMD